MTETWWDEYAEGPWKGISSLVLVEAGIHCDADGIVHVPYPGRTEPFTGSTSLRRRRTLLVGDR